MKEPATETAAEPAPIFTIGHSTHPLHAFIGLLTTHGAETLIDIRTVPRSGHNPQFNEDTLPGALSEAGIGYLAMPGLGGLRKPKPHSVNTAWRNASFRGFADYMASAEFASALAQLQALSEQARVVMMCAEAAPWRCHRALISDVLTFRNRPVRHIVATGRAAPHNPTPFARFEGGIVIYPACAQRELDWDF
jgi:uncharacterized protein (DUF488 family)